MKQKELISYSVINVDIGERKIVSENEVSLDNLSSLGVELQGNNLLELGKTFLEWRLKAMEIIYRPSSSKKAFVIFSRLDQKDYFRSEDILGSILWPEDELRSFAKVQETDGKKEIVLQLYKLGEDGSLPSFLRQLYKINPQKEKVVLEGMTSPYLFLLALDWFVGKSKMILYDNDLLI